MKENILGFSFRAFQPLAENNLGKMLWKETPVEQ